MLQLSSTLLNTLYKVGTKKNSQKESKPVLNLCKNEHWVHSKLVLCFYHESACNHYHGEVQCLKESCSQKLMLCYCIRQYDIYSRYDAIVLQNTSSPQAMNSPWRYIFWIGTGELEIIYNNSALMIIIMILVNCKLTFSLLDWHKAAGYTSDRR